MKIKYIAISLLVIIISYFILYNQFVMNRRGHSSPKEMTIMQMSKIMKFMLYYENDYSMWPSSEMWKYDLEQYDNDEDFRDGWGNPIQYLNSIENNNRRIILYSFGENGIDDNGFNDDYFFDLTEWEHDKFPVLRVGTRVIE